MGLSLLIGLSVASRSPRPKVTVNNNSPIQDYVLDKFTRTIKLNLHFKFLNQLIFLFSFTVGPRLTEVPERFLVITEEAVASLTCEAFSYPPSVITWTRSLGSLPRRRSSIRNGTLTIRDFYIADTGTYVCTASNKLGSVTVATTLGFQRKIGGN